MKKRKSPFGEDRGVSIRYRKNLTGLRLQTDLSGVYTKIMPTGLKENGQTLLKLPELYVTSPLVENYTHVKTTRIHYGDIQVDENTTEEQIFEKLRNAATLEFENGLDKPSITATVEFIPLQETQEYKNFAVLERVCLGDTVSVYHEDLKIDLQAKVTSYEFDALSKRYNKVMIGNVQVKYGQTQKKYVQQVTEETAEALQQSYKQNVTESINTVEMNLTQAFQEADSKLSSTISQTYLTIESATSTYATQNLFEQTTESIMSEMARAQNAEAALSKSISQNAGNIDLKVSKGDVSNQLSTESEPISISSDRLTVDSTNFNLSEDGRMTCTNADVSGTVKSEGTYGCVELSDGRITVLDVLPDAAYQEGQTATQTFVTDIEENEDGTLTWRTKTITFTKGVMTNITMKEEAT